MTARPRSDSALHPLARILLRRVAVRRGSEVERPGAVRESVVATDPRADDEAAAPRDSATLRTPR